jgi:hypothetical protein
MTTLQQVEAGLKANFESKLVDELLEAFQEAKRNYYLGGLRLNAVEGGRFCEAAFRMLEQKIKGTFTPLGKQIDSQKIISAAEQANIPDGIRIHIPRALRMVYDIRNKRDAAHLADGIDPNLLDATLVVAALDWTFAEFVRLFHGVSANEAQKIISDLVRKRVPAVQDINGYLKIQNPKLQVSDRLLVLLYERGAKGATRDELRNWLHPKMRKNLGRALYQLEHDRALVHSTGDTFQIAEAGMRDVEDRRLHEVRQ